MQFEKLLEAIVNEIYNIWFIYEFCLRMCASGFHHADTLTLCRINKSKQNELKNTTN